MEQDRTVDPVGRAVSRRRFVGLLLSWSIVTSVATVVVPIIGFLIPPKRPSAAAAGKLLVGTTADIAPGRSKVVALGTKPVIVLSSSQGLKAFSAVCTHLGCIVGYDASKSPDIVSPCHDGHFSALNGTVLSGPPPAPLKQYPVVVQENDIYVQDA